MLVLANILLVADTVNDTYIQASGDESGTKSYGEVTDLLLNWYYQHIYLPAHADDEEDSAFDPFDEGYVFEEGLEAAETP